MPGNNMKRSNVWRLNKKHQKIARDFWAPNKMLTQKPYAGVRRPEPCLRPYPYDKAFSMMTVFWNEYPNNTSKI